MKVLIIVILCILTLLATQVVNDNIILGATQVSDSLHSHQVTVEVSHIEESRPSYVFIHPNSAKRDASFFYAPIPKDGNSVSFLCKSKKYIL